MAPKFVDNAFSFERKSVSTTLQGKKCALYQTVTFSTGKEAVKLSTKDKCCCCGDIAIFYHAAIIENEPAQAIVFNTAIVDLDALSVTGRDLTLPDGFDITHCHDTMKSFLKSLRDEKGETTFQEISETNALAGTSEAGKMSELPDTKTNTTSTPGCEVVSRDCRTRSKRAVSLKKKFSPDQTALRISLKSKRSTKRIAMGRLMESAANTSTTVRNKPMDKVTNRVKRVC